MIETQGSQQAKRPTEASTRATVIEVLVEAAHREAGFLHQFRNSESCEALFIARLSLPGSNPTINSISALT